MKSDIDQLVAMQDTDSLHEIMAEDHEWLNQLDAAEGLVKLGDRRGYEFLLSAAQSDDDGLAPARLSLALTNELLRPCDSRQGAVRLGRVGLGLPATPGIVAVRRDVQVGGGRHASGPHQNDENQAARKSAHDGFLVAVLAAGNAVAPGFSHGFPPGSRLSHRPPASAPPRRRKSMAWRPAEREWTFRGRSSSLARVWLSRRSMKVAMSPSNVL